MKRNYFRVAGVLISALVVWQASVGNAMAANPTALVVFFLYRDEPGHRLYRGRLQCQPVCPSKILNRLCGPARSSAKRWIYERERVSTNVHKQRWCRGTQWPRRDLHHLYGDERHINLWQFIVYR